LPFGAHTYDKLHTLRDTHFIAIVTKHIKSITPMNYRILILGILISISSKGFSNNLSDTINVTIDLRQLDSLGLKVNIYTPSDLKGLSSYQFPKSIPGIYEYLNDYESIIKLSQNREQINCLDNSFSINCDSSQSPLTYFAKSTVNRFKGISAEDTYYLKDSIYILNWHYILGFFNSQTKHPYKIEIIKKADLLGTGSLTKKVKSDIADIYIARNYKELIHNPIMYSIPDTTNFKIGKTNFTISCAGNDSLLDSKKIKDLLLTPLAEIISKSHYKHDSYSFLFYSTYSLTPPYLTGLEHPNSTLICYHSALLDNNILISSSIHEYIHAVYAPLRIRSEVINEFEFNNPKCDEFLWFYEGVTEYLAIKTLVNSGFFKPKDFFNELDESNDYHENINFNKVSLNIYKKKEQKLFDNFYTKGSLFAMQLDLEIIKCSNGKTDLFDVMQKLQELFNPENPFNSKSFMSKFSTVSGIDIYNYLNKNTSTREKINYPGIIEQIGYKKELRDTLIWSYEIRKTHLITNYKKERLEVALFGSNINNQLKIKKVTFYEINKKPLTWYNYDILLAPNSEKEYSFTAIIKDSCVFFNARPKLILKANYHVNWIENKNIETELAKRFWGR
jgi:predicted metalloprotease with PDZ domain